jgi:ribose transport system ATP-binding protein
MATASTIGPDSRERFEFEFVGVSKGFFGVPVLKEIRFGLSSGEVLGLVGENGAGKSTLMNILGGNLAADGGHMLWNGATYEPRNPQAATAQGIAFIHQELNLFTNLSIAENLFITAFPRRRGTAGGLIDRVGLARRARVLLEQVGLALPPDTLVENLSPGERQLVEIAKALSIEARLIIFDEPTTSLTARECEHLFGLMARLRAQGRSLIYISHALNDVMRLCDRLVVLRDGVVVGMGPTREFDLDRLVTLMVGRSLNQFYPERTVAPSTDPILEVLGLSHPGVVAGISFDLHRREILGVAGLMGSGRTELARILFGLDPCEQGEIRLGGRRLTRSALRRRIQAGLAFLTENRREEGLCMEASIAENMALVSLPAFARAPAGLVRMSHLDASIRDLCQSVRLAGSARMTDPVRQLSGGNQQKVVLAKWLLHQPQVFVLDEPTRGIDVGAKYEVHRLIAELAARGAGVLMISSEIEELIGMCDRILVMSRGEIRDTIDRRDFNRERILRAALAGAHPRADASPAAAITTGASSP